MKHSRLLTLVLAAGILFILPLLSLAADTPERKKGPPPSDEQKEKVTPKKATPPVGMPVYKPPLRGAPGGRVGGGTRGIKDELITLFVLAPDHTGLTVREQPTLYWYLSKLTDYPIELTIIEDQAISPVLEKRIRPPVQAGIQRVRLADYEVRLSPRKEYWWFVAVVPDPDRRSRDILAGGLIERVEIPESLRVQLGQAEKGEIPRVYAEAGIWYDALMTISDLIEATPQDPVLRKQRAALLAQVGLSEIAGDEEK